MVKDITKMKKHLLCFAIFYLILHTVNAQTTDSNLLLYSLRTALFSDSKEIVEISVFFGYNKQRVDSIYFVRKVQPDVDVVMPLLKKIAYTKDISLLHELINLYNEQQSFFKKEWEPVFRNNTYACDAANEQFWILESFEEAIHALRFKNIGLGRDGKFAYYRKYLQSQYSYYHVPGAWPEALKGWHIYSPYYLMLRENRWVAPPLDGFSFIEPYVNDIVGLMIDELSSHFEQLDTVDIKITFEQFELDKLCYIISLAKDVPFYEKLIEIILSDRRNKHVFVRSRIKQLIKNPAFKEKLKSSLLERTNSINPIVRLNALYGLIFFSDTDVIAQYQKLLKTEKIGFLEKQAIESHLFILNSQLNVSEETKELGAQLLKQMKS